MSAIRAIVESRPRQIVIAAIYSAIIGALSIILAVSGVANGEVPAIGRTLLGLLGIAAAVLLWTRPTIGWIALIAWSAIQIPYIAWNTDGSPLVQVISFPLTFSSSTRVNGEITTFSEYGINLVGVALTMVAAKWRTDWPGQDR